MNTHPKIAAAHSREERHASLTSLARAHGFAPGFARQIASLALEVEKQTGATAEQYLRSTANLCAIEGRENMLGEWVPRVAGRPLGRFRAAMRHAGKFVRRAMLRG